MHFLDDKQSSRHTFDASRVSSRRYFTYEILSYETVDPILNILHFQCF